jgi:hydroxymethylbilane synthase
MTPSRILIGTRGSALALAQTNWVAAQLQALHPGLTVETQIIHTRGDKIRDVALSKVGGQGLFTKELENALLTGEVDLAVHSLKDLPTDLPAGLCVGAVPARVDPHDVLVLPEEEIRKLGNWAAKQGKLGCEAGETGLRSRGNWETGKLSNQSQPPEPNFLISQFPLAHLRSGARVGTSSLRRQAQLRHARPDLEWVDLRGNLDTRLRKLDAGDYDAIVLAAAGLERMGWSDRISERLPFEVCLPAVGQGALGLECRRDDDGLLALLQPLNHLDTLACVTAERAFLSALGGGCQVPIGAIATIEEEQQEIRQLGNWATGQLECETRAELPNCLILRLRGMIASVDGATVVRDEVTGVVGAGLRASPSGELGEQLAARLLEEGAAVILREVRG